MGPVQRRRRSGAGRALALGAVLVPLLAGCAGGGKDRTAPSTTTRRTSTTTAAPPATSRPPTTPPATIGPVETGTFDDVIPRPVAVAPADGRFPLTSATAIRVEGDAPADDAVALLRSSVGPATGLRLPTAPARPARGASLITFAATSADLGPEGYELRVAPDHVTVAATGHDGFVWAVQTLRQLLPPAAGARSRQPGTFAIPAGTIRDRPRYPWRGVMLDVARHWFGPTTIRQVVDLASAYKMDRLHLHLSDDQGWRIAIRGYPDLARVGGRSQVGGGPGGSLSQADYRSLVAYAQQRGVTIVPEIDVPGHTNAALTAVPGLNCDGKAPPVRTDMEVGYSSLCIGTPATDRWLDTVVGEIAALTPGRWFHLGGDESHATPPEQYRAFIAHAAQVVRDHGKVPVGWDEIGTADLGGPAVAQHWVGAANTRAAAAQGADVVLSPASRAYLDMKYTEDGPGNVWAGLIDTRTAYGWDPATEVEGLDPARILGVEGPLWTELVRTPEDVQLRYLPRLPALAEVGWSPQATRDWSGFASRIATHAERWTDAGLSSTRDPSIPWPR